jgi:CheY-like chemotaxis protein
VSGSGEPPRQARLLIVEDELAIAVAMSEYLSVLGYAVETVRDRPGAEALLAAGRHDLMIADLRLRTGDTLDGLRLVQRAAALVPRPRILVLTGYGSPGLEAELAAAGVDLVLSKPQPLGTVAEAVAALLASGAGLESGGGESGLATEGVGTPDGRAGANRGEKD